MSGRSTVAVAVVGSGAAGIELAFALHHRLRSVKWFCGEFVQHFLLTALLIIRSETAAVPHVTLVDQQPRLLAHEPSHAAAATTIEAAAAAAGICVSCLAAHEYVQCSL